MSFQIELDPFDRAYAHFVRRVREAIQKTFAEEAAEGLTQKELAEALQVNEALISRRLNGPGNITLKTISDLFTAMGRVPLSNFETPLNQFANEALAASYWDDKTIQIDSAASIKNVNSNFEIISNQEASGSLSIVTSKKITEHA